MIPLVFTIRERGATPGIMARDRNRVYKLAFEWCGRFWHRNYRPKHFTKAGGREYGYKPRKGEPGNPVERKIRGRLVSVKSGGYTARKKREKGHTRPLEYSGESKTLTRIRDVRATSKGVRVVIHARGLNRRHPKSKINMRQEMETVSQRERRVLVETYDRRLDVGFNRIQRRTRTRIGG